MSHKCEVCDRNLSSEYTLKKHYESKIHQKNIDIAANFLKKEKNQEKYAFVIKSKGEVVGETIVDKDVYYYIKNNMYSVSYSKGYARIQIKEKKYGLNRYIYYTFHKNKITPGTYIDHINNNKLDNQLKNLREVTHLENTLNRSKGDNTTSKYYGVSRATHKNWWQCQLKHNDMHCNFLYPIETHAAYHYDLLIKKHNLQEFKKLNNVEKPDNFVEKTGLVKKDNLPRGINKYNKNTYYISFKEKQYYGFATIEEATSQLNFLIKEADQRKQTKILSKPIKKNDDGIAIIELFDKKKQKTGETMVSDEDYYNLMKYNWYSRDNRVLGTVCRKTVSLSRFIMDYKGSDMIDHIDCNTLNNQRSNLRILTATQNSQNKHKSKLPSSSSKYIGVSYDKSRNKWKSGIKLNGKTINLGRFNTELEAAQIRDKKAIELNSSGETCFKLNF
jgi:HNH endonuclease/AP2 domain/Zinc-finger double-stranded RNA-binding